MPMAWNEPGRGKRSAPSDGNNVGGLPDLEQVFSKFSNKLHSFFGGGKNSMQRSPSENGIGIWVGFIFVIILVTYLVTGFYIVKPAEQCVILRFGQYNRTVGSGPHWYPRLIEEKHIVNTEELVSTRHTGTMLTKDANLVTADIQVQYRISDVNNYLFKVNEPEKSLKQAAESALRQSIGQNYLDFVITEGRSNIEEQTLQQIRMTLNSYDAGLHASTVTLREAKAPEQVKAAFDDATKAREDKERFLHEAEAYFNKIVPEARGHSQKIIQDSEAYKQELINYAIGDVSKFQQILPEYIKAPKITKIRLYLDSLEKIFINTSKVLVDLDSGNNLLYLPVDRLLNLSEKKDNKQITQVE